jgi:hypothetical protein
MVGNGTFAVFYVGERPLYKVCFRYDEQCFLIGQPFTDNGVDFGQFRFLGRCDTVVS